MEDDKKEERVREGRDKKNKKITGGMRREIRREIRYETSREAKKRREETGRK